MTPTPSRRPFTSALAETIASYLRLKEALGRRYAVERAILRALDGFLTDAHADLTADTFAAWDATLTRLTSGVRRNWLRVARNLCLYRCRTCPTAFVPDIAAFPKPHRPVRPHIFTDEEMRASCAPRSSCDPHPRPRPGGPCSAWPSSFCTRPVFAVASCSG